jgi:phosphohistidine phosphatase
MTERRIVLLRHAQAGQSPGLPDFDRPLTALGAADAAAAGQWLADHHYRPDTVICSPAQRTRQTWHGVALGLTELAGRPSRTSDPLASPNAPIVHYEAAVYQHGAQELLDLLRALDPSRSTVLLIGHNPSVSQLSYLLDPTHPISAGLGTSDMAVHRVTGDWATVDQGEAPVTDRFTAHA